MALGLQAVFFQFGGITTLGVNTVIMALPAVLCYYLFGRLVGKGPRIALPVAFLCGALSVFLGGILVALALTFTEENFLKASYLVVMAHIPVMVVEGIITAFCVAFLKKVQPEMLPGESPVTGERDFKTSWGRRFLSPDIVFQRVLMTIFLKS